MSYLKYGRETEHIGYDAKDQRTKAIIFDENDFGKLIMYGSETRNHFIAKSVVLYELRKLKHRCVCEVEVSGVGRLDIYDLDTNCIYELESDQCVNRSRKAKKKFLQAGIDIVIIPIPQTDSLKEFIETIQAYIRPD